jgi:hypothetical protein
MLLRPKATIISGDHERLQQIVWHLLSNAIKLTRDGGAHSTRTEACRSIRRSQRQRQRNQDGALVLNEARAVSAARGEHLTAIAITADGGDAKARAQRAGCALHLARSIDPSTLAAAIAALTRQKAH